MLKLKLPNSDTEYPIDTVTFKKAEGDSGNYFLLTSTVDTNIQITVPYELPLYSNYLTTEFDCYPFSSTTYYKEQNIFEVKVNDKKIDRIGWIFPLQSLSSTEHSFIENEHFLRYAFVTFHKLLLGEYFNFDHIFDVNEPSEQLTITDIYNSRLIVLCTSKSKTGKIVNFDIHNYIPSLYSSRYFYCSNSQDIELETKDDIDESRSDIVVKEVSTSLKNDIFIISLFKTLLRKSKHPLVQFHLLYQVVEILINKIYDIEINHILLVSQRREKNMHEILQKITKIQTEKYRINKLIDSYLISPLPSKSLLIEKCSAMLQLVEEAEKEHVGESFYKVRSAIVHNFRTISLNDPGNLIFTQFVEIFELFIVELLINYNNQIDKYDSQPLEWLKYQLQNEN